MRFYQQGRYDDALHEFKKALLVNPNYPPALQYISMLEEMRRGPSRPAGGGIVLPQTPATALPASGRVSHTLDLIEMEQAMISERASGQKALLSSLLPPAVAPAVPSPAKQPKLSSSLRLEAALSAVTQPIEVEQDTFVSVTGASIRRYLVTVPDVVTIERESQDTIRVIGRRLGYTYVHVWDSNSRWTLYFLTTPPKPVGRSLEDELRRAEELAGNFKVRYAMDWNSYETGRRLTTTERTYYAYSHLLSIDGPTPYGEVDSSVSLRSLSGEIEPSSFTIGINKGALGPFKDFSLRAFDFHPDISNLALRDPYQRGVLVKSLAFDKKLDYTAFWGREQFGINTVSLSPGLQKTVDSFLAGMTATLIPDGWQHYSVTVAHGWGRSRSPDLNAYAYDADARYKLGDWDVGYELAHDSETAAHLLTASFRAPRLQFTSEVRNNDKDFKTLTGFGYRAGELGVLSTVYCTPIDDLNIAGSFDLFKDRRFPSPSNDDRWNEDLRWRADYILGRSSHLWLDYSLQNYLGKIGEYRYQNAGFGASAPFEVGLKVSAFFSYRHQENENYSAPVLDYTNEKAIGGLRVNLPARFSYFIDQEYNWLTAKDSGERSTPMAMNTGVDWSERISSTPFFATARFLYRDEEHTSSPLGFLAGEDSIEGYGELTYRPQPGSEVYCSSRIRNVWAENPDAEKRMEAEFRAGARYLWNTGLRWESVGMLQGYVFKDYNEDGIRQRDEPPVEGVRVWLGKQKEQLTDCFGSFFFSRVRAKKAYISIDVASLPRGFVLTGPAAQETLIAHGRGAEVYFGMVSRSEISGMIFEDVNANGRYDQGEPGLKGVAVALENGRRVVTEPSGKYVFRKASAGKHTLTLDLKSLPPQYIPAVPVFKELQLFEGITFQHDIPVRQTRK